MAEHVRSSILNGSYRPGQRLIEADLTRDTGAGRAHVREALRQLWGEGLVHIEENRGATVKRLSREDVYLAGRVREALEGLAARQLAERTLANDERAALHTLRRRLVEAAENRDFDRYSEANEQLHAFIVQRSGNPFLESFLERLRVVVRLTQHLQLYRDTDVLDGNVEHLAIIEAILIGNGEVAESMMRMHVRKGTQTIDRWLAQGS